MEGGIKIWWMESTWGEFFQVGGWANLRHVGRGFPQSPLVGKILAFLCTGPLYPIFTCHLFNVQELHIRYLLAAFFMYKNHIFSAYACHLFIYRKYISSVCLPSFLWAGTTYQAWYIRFLKSFYDFNFLR